MDLHFFPLDHDTIAALRRGAPDANGQVAERARSGGVGTPCRCCLRNVPKGDEMLIAAARPFDRLGPYAETGPIFLCAEDCEAWAGSSVPPVLTASPEYLIKGYSGADRIVPGTGRIVPADEIVDYAGAVLDDSEIAYVDIRSARNNCWLARARRM